VLFIIYGSKIKRSFFSAEKRRRYADDADAREVKQVSS